MTYIIKISLDNDVFVKNGANETARILEDIAKTCRHFADVTANKVKAVPKTLFDVNGNNVGRATVKGEKEEF